MPVIDSSMQTSIEGVFAVGDVCGITDENAAERQGTLAGRGAAGVVAHATESLAATHKNGAQSEVEYWESWRRSLVNGQDKDVTVCLCEEVSRADIESVSPPRYLGWPSRKMGDRSLATLFQEAPVNLDRLKRLTRAGMGYCQGRRCREEVALISAEASGVDASEVPLATFRTPVRPLPLRSMWDGEEVEEVRTNWPKWFRKSNISLDSLGGEG